MTLHLTLPWHPCACPDNAAYRAVPSRGVLLSKRGRAAKAATFAHACAATRGRLLTGRLTLTCLAYPPDAIRRDVGNLRKLLTDALQGAVYGDDCQLVSETWTLGPIDRANPRLELTVTPAPPRCPAIGRKRPATGRAGRGQQMTRPAPDRPATGPIGANVTGVTVPPTPEAP